MIAHPYGVLALAATPLVTAASDPASGNTDWIGYLLQGGPFAIILVLILTDKLAPTGERNRLRDEIKQYKADMQNLNDKLLEVLPPLTEATQTITKVGDMIEHMQDPDFDRRSPSQQPRGRGGYG